MSVSGNRSWARGGAGAGFFFLWLDAPPAELRLDSDDADPNLSLLFVINDLRGNGRGSGVALLRMHSTSNLRPENLRAVTMTIIVSFECNIMLSGRNLVILQKNTLPPSSK